MKGRNQEKLKFGGKHKITHINCIKKNNQEQKKTKHK